MKTGVNTFGVRHLMQKDFDSTITSLKEIGVEVLEIMLILCGNGPEEEAVIQEKLRSYHLDGLMWTESVARQRIAAIRQAGMQVYGAHLANPMDMEPDEVPKLARSIIRFAKENNLTYFVFSPMVGEIDKIKRTARALESLIPMLKEESIDILFHNHETELAPDGDTCVFDYLMDTVPDLKVQLDVGWVQFAGVDPLALMEKYKDRIAVLHFKDIAPDACKENRDTCFTAIGEGSIPLKEIIAYAQHLNLLPAESVIDQDNSNGDMLEDIRKGIENIDRASGADLYHIDLKPWETLPDAVRKVLPVIESVNAPELTGEPEIGKFYRIYPEKCLCGDGSRFHGLVRIGRKPDKLLVFFNGGGLSWNAYTAARPNSFFTQHLEENFYFNNTHWMADYSLKHGIAADRADNPFLDWTMVQVPYSTGDFHCGTGDFPYTALDGSAQILPHHGYLNTMALLRKVQPLIGNPKTLLIAGVSAGGFGVSLMAEDVIEMFPSCENIVTVVDSATLAFHDWPHVARDVWQAPEHICSRLFGDNLMLDSYSALYRKYGNRVKYLFICSTRDALLTQAQNALDGNGLRADRESGLRFQEGLKRVCDRLREQIPGIGLYIFEAPMGEDQFDQEGLTKHCLLDNPKMYEHCVDGKTATQWLLNALDGAIESVGLDLL